MPHGYWTNDDQVQLNGHNIRERNAADARIQRANQQAALVSAIEAGLRYGIAASPDIFTDFDFTTGEAAEVLATWLQGRRR